MPQVRRPGSYIVNLGMPEFNVALRDSHPPTQSTRIGHVLINHLCSAHPWTLITVDMTQVHRDEQIHIAPILERRTRSVIKMQKRYKRLLYTARKPYSTCVPWRSYRCDHVTLHLRYVETYLARIRWFSCSGGADARVELTLSQSHWCHPLCTDEGHRSLETIKRLPSPGLRSEMRRADVSRLASR